MPIKEILKSNAKMLRLLAATLVGVAIGVTSFSCKDSKSYAELLTQENQAVNLFLVDQRVTNTIPTDTTFVFETGPDAPYYRLDEDGNMYMQVLDPGTPGNYAKSDEVLYFRFTRYNLNYYSNGQLPSGDGNDTDMTYNSSWFRFKNFSLRASYQWGSGVQQPLYYLPVDAEVNIVIKSQYGVTSETTQVIPYLYHIRYYRQKT